MPRKYRRVKARNLHGKHVHRTPSGPKRVREVDHLTSTPLHGRVVKVAYQDGTVAVLPPDATVEVEA